ncbi:hypothetical protein Cadr_000002194 [Camelus dromedarius]|uniref:Uncharacterized protein n=1 Tax=Camelus dromedarius TaxID=9838 RepID=A0A5N4EG55_CAMDR|nr:hypothetical protein Cadr_000002194 [Camelus dromedarius]
MPTPVTCPGTLPHWPCLCHSGRGPTGFAQRQMWEATGPHGAGAHLVPGQGGGNSWRHWAGAPKCRLHMLGVGVLGKPKRGSPKREWGGGCGKGPQGVWKTLRVNGSIAVSLGDERGCLSTWLEALRWKGFGGISAMAEVVPQMESVSGSRRKIKMGVGRGTWVTWRGSWAFGEVSGCRGTEEVLGHTEGISGAWRGVRVWRGFQRAWRGLRCLQGCQGTEGILGSLEKGLGHMEGIPDAWRGVGAWRGSRGSGGGSLAAAGGRSAGLALALAPPLLVLGVLLRLARPGPGPAQPHHAAGQPAARVAVLHAGLVAAAAQVILALVDHHGAPTMACGPQSEAFRPERYFQSWPSRTASCRVARVLRVRHPQRVVVRPGGVAALGQVPELVQVDGAAGDVGLGREALQVEEGSSRGRAGAAGRARGPSPGLRRGQRGRRQHGRRRAAQHLATRRPPLLHLLPDLRHFGVHVADLLLHAEAGVLRVWVGPGFRGVCRHEQVGTEQRQHGWSRAPAGTRRGHWKPEIPGTLVSLNPTSPLPTRGLPCPACFCSFGPCLSRACCVPGTVFGPPKPHLHGMGSLRTVCPGVGLDSRYMREALMALPDLPLPISVPHLCPPSLCILSCRHGLQEGFPEEVTFEGLTRQVAVFQPSQVRSPFQARDTVHFVGGGNSVWLEHGLCLQGGLKAEEKTLSQGLRSWVCCAKVRRDWLAGWWYQALRRRERGQIRPEPAEGKMLVTAQVRCSADGWKQGGSQCWLHIRFWFLQIRRPGLTQGILIQGEGQDPSQERLRKGVTGRGRSLESDLKGTTSNVAWLLWKEGTNPEARPWPQALRHHQVTMPLLLSCPDSLGLKLSLRVLEASPQKAHPSHTRWGGQGYHRTETMQATKPVPPSWVWVWEDCTPLKALGGSKARALSEKGPDCNPKPASPTPHPRVPLLNSPLGLALLDPRTVTFSPVAFFTSLPTSPLLPFRAAGPGHEVCFSPQKMNKYSSKKRSDAPPQDQTHSQECGQTPGCLWPRREAAGGVVTARKEGHWAGLGRGAGRAGLAELPHLFQLCPLLPPPQGRWGSGHTLMLQNPGCVSSLGCAPGPAPCASVSSSVKWGYEANPVSGTKAHMGKGSLPACLSALQSSFNKRLVGAHSTVCRYPKLYASLPSGVHALGSVQQCQQIPPVQSGDYSWEGWTGPLPRHQSFWLTETQSIISAILAFPQSVDGHGENMLNPEGAAAAQPDVAT